MNFIQLLPFDISKGGNVPNLCLDNVRKGYGIGNKYGSAWEAWQHTQQHTGRDVPAGLDVPIYYSYTTTINGVTENFGHINVRLKNGTVWSDGNIYASIDDYMSKKLPKFVGWGESVNDFKVIQGEEMKTWNNGDTYNLLFKSVNAGVAEQAKAANYVGFFGAQDGEEFDKAMYDIINSSQYAFMVADAQKGATPSDATILKPGEYRVQ